MHAQANGDQATIEVYERNAAAWEEARGPAVSLDGARSFASRVQRIRVETPTLAGLPVADLGCGPGWHLPAFESPVVALDRARSMLDLARRRSASALLVQADLSALPFRRRSLAGAWASKSYVHLARPWLPLALAELHWATEVGAPIELRVFAGDADFAPFADDDFPGRRFSLWTRELLSLVVEGAGFSIESLNGDWNRTGGIVVVRARREWSLPDTVGPGMRLLVCGLNPSEFAADAGVGFARPGNRFWPAALAAKLVSRDRDPRHALIAHGVGMTDLVKRPTARADQLRADEYRAGMERLTRLVTWLRPTTVCFVGLAGWRAAVNPRSIAGPQPEWLGASRVYVMPSTSGANASSSLEDLTAHLRAAAAMT
ncbi:MAG: methyltransferase domain-containing protein [Acidimicrobiales bacterium]|nr:methyltransferase domain-containing protein [Acidimicrobiales bacterium]